MAANQPWSKPGFYVNLTNGVSQQPPRVRMESQQDEAFNVYPTTINQMAGQRPPLEIVSELDGLDSWLDIATNGYPYHHSYTRDASESYEIFLDGDGGLRVYDRFTGAQKTVNISSADTYLTADDPEQNFVLRTYKDVTFVINRTKTVQMAASLSATRTSEALVRVKDWVTGATYSVTVNFGATSITVTPTGTDVNTVAADLVVDLLAHGSWPVGATAVQYGNVVHIRHSTLTSVKVSDNRAGTAIQGFRDEVLKQGDLTPYGPHGYLVKVTGTNSSASAQDQNTADDQYYKFVADDGSGGSGKWVETLAPGIKYQIDAATAPHTLTRNADGTFTFNTISWGTRNVGDETTNPDPVFIGQTIRNIFLLGNRLGFLAGNQFIGSQVGEESWFEFFRRTTAATLDDDPVYATVPSDEVNNVYHAMAWNGELLLLGDVCDGVVNYGNKFALSNLNVTTPTVTSISQICPPILSGSDLFFITELGDWSNLGVYNVNDVNGIRSADSITDSYLGQYIPKNVKRMSGRAKDFMAILSTETRDKLYIMSYSKKAERLVQQAIVEWDFSNIPDIDILDIAVHKHHLFVTYRGPDSRYYLGRLDTSPSAADTGYPFKCVLDHRMEAEGVYDSGTGLTTFTLPYRLTDGDKRVVIAGADDDSLYIPGQDLTIASDTDTAVTIEGDLSEANLSVFVGYGITRYFVPNPITMKATNPSTGQRTADLLKEGQLNRIAIGFFKSQYFKVELLSRLTQDADGNDRQLAMREFRGGLQLDNCRAKLDSNRLTYSGVLLLSGEGASVDDCYIKISSDSHLPFIIDMIQWVGPEYDISV